MENSEVVTVTFTKHVIVSGIVLQGNSEKNGWITKFALSYQKSKDQDELTNINTVSSLFNLILDIDWIWHIFNDVDI